jgi:hypothetical protein
MSAQAARVARWHIFKTKNPNLGKFCSWRYWYAMLLFVT